MSATNVRVAVAGHVDHGKSTLIGRLLTDTGQVREDRVAKVEQMCASTHRKFEYAFLLDALEEEQSQGITIDVTEVPWTYRGREFTLIDTPGHREFLKNMIGGATRADAALLIIDALEGLKTHFQRQVAVLGVLGIPKILVAINKMDLVDWAEATFRERVREVEHVFRSTGVPLPQILPVGAWEGVNLTTPAGARMPWYKGPSLADALSDLPPPPARDERPLRMPLQDVYKFDDRRINVGRLESGLLKRGDHIQFWPSGRDGVVQDLVDFPHECARPGDAIGFTLKDPVFVERGELIGPAGAPARRSRALTADLFWLSPRPLKVGQSYGFRCATAETTAVIEAIESVLDAETLTQTTRQELEAGAVGRVRLNLQKPIAHDFFADNERTGRFVLVEDHLVAGGGRILADQRAYLSVERSEVSLKEREQRFGHSGLVVWCTGLSGSGKSTLMRALERDLFTRGANVFVLDGDNVRRGLCADLGFSDADRSENIRRAAEVARLFADAGAIVLCAFLSPFARDRAHAREIIGADRFVEVFVDCPLDECERRDPKSLYRRARQGEVTQFTGLTSGYEPPEAPDIHLRTDQLTIEACLERCQALFTDALRP